MAENEKRKLVQLNGLIGLLIAVLILLTIEISLITKGYFVQQDNATNYYDIKKQELQMFSEDNAKLKIDAK